MSECNEADRVRVCKPNNKSSVAKHQVALAGRTTAQQDPPQHSRTHHSTADNVHHLSSVTTFPQKSITFMRRTTVEKSRVCESEPDVKPSTMAELASPNPNHAIPCSLTVLPFWSMIWSLTVVK